MDLPFSTEDLTRLYRFALLLTGDEVVAQQVFYDACAETAPRLAGFRNEDGQIACLMTALRQKARASQTVCSDGRPAIRAFATLPEEERAALAGLYTGLLPTKALAEALKMTLEQMGRTLKSARHRLEPAAEQLGEPTLEQAL